MRFYLDESICQTLGIPYYTSKKSVHMVSIGKILTLHDEWDDKQRSILAGFVRAGRYNIKAKSQGYGNFEILNYPNFINPSKETV
jgi:hypothetical protein